MCKCFFCEYCPGRKTIIVKVFVLVRDLDVGGTQRQAVCIANELARCGIEVDLVTFYHVQTNQPLT